MEIVAKVDIKGNRIKMLRKEDIGRVSGQASDKTDLGV
jgi:hypothetical protein